jgi:LPS-assembly protein
MGKVTGMRRRWVVWAAAAGLWALLLLLGGPAQAEELELFKAERFKGGSWLIKADKLAYDSPSRSYIGQGRVELRQGDRRLTADWAQVFEVTKIAQVKGHVVIVVEGDILSGDAGFFNLATNCGEMHGARLFLKMNHFHVAGPLIRKTGENTYYAKDCNVSTCDADRPVWSFFAKEMEVEREGYGVGKDSQLKLLGVPVMYSPYTVLPVITIRQSGFLLPQYAAHRLGGQVFEAPFYWAMSNQSDLTFYNTYLSNRGYMPGVEYRYARKDDSALDIRFSYLNDKMTQDTTPNRFWVAGMVNEKLPGNWSLRGTLDKVSDPDYLKDFNFGYQALNRYSTDMSQIFGRGLETEEVHTRVSTLLLENNSTWAYFGGFVRYYDRLLKSDPVPFQRLPNVNLNTVAIPLGGNNQPILLGMESAYGYFLQNQGLGGHRLDMHPQVAYQVQPITGYFFSSRVGMRESFFKVDQGLTPNDAFDTSRSRNIYDAKIALESAWVRDYGRDTDPEKFYRNVIRPEVAYWNISNFNPQRFPPFDPFDQGWRERTNRNLPIRDGDEPIGGVNALTYGFSSSFLSRSKTPAGAATVREIVWFRLSQSAFFNSSDLGLNGKPQPHHQFSDFLAETEVHPWQYFVVGTDLGVSPYNEGLERVNFKLLFLDIRRQQFLNISYLYLKDFAHQVNFRVFVNVFDSVKTWLVNSQTFLNSNKLESQYGVIFQRQCWGVSLSYTDRPDDKRFGFTVFIPGIGDKFQGLPSRIPDARKTRDQQPY